MHSIPHRSGLSPPQKVRVNHIMERDAHEEHVCTSAERVVCGLHTAAFFHGIGFIIRADSSMNRSCASTSKHCQASSRPPQHRSPGTTSANATFTSLPSWSTVALVCITAKSVATASAAPRSFQNPSMLPITTITRIMLALMRSPRTTIESLRQSGSA